MTTFVIFLNFDLHLISLDSIADYHKFGPFVPSSMTKKNLKSKAFDRITAFVVSQHLTTQPPSHRY